MPDSTPPGASRAGRRAIETAHPTGITDSPALLRCCVDLNVWQNADRARFAARLAPQSPSAATEIIGLLAAGQGPAGPLQMVLSARMLGHYEAVLQRNLGVAPEAARALTDAMADMARLGPLGIDPLLIVDGGVYPNPDPEDAAIIEVALAGQADLLVTRDAHPFMGPNVRPIGKIPIGVAGHVISAGRPPLLVAQPPLALHVLRHGIATPWPDWLVRAVAAEHREVVRRVSARREHEARRK